MRIKNRKIGGMDKPSVEGDCFPQNDAEAFINVHSNRRYVRNVACRSKLFTMAHDSNQ